MANLPIPGIVYEAAEPPDAAPKFDITKALHLLKETVPMFVERNVLYIYDSGVYFPCNSHEATVRFRSFFPPQVAESVPSQAWREIVTRLLCDPLLQMRERPQLAPNLIPFSNCLYDVFTETMVPHSPAAFLTSCNNAAFFPEAQLEGPVTEAFLQHVTGGDPIHRELLLEATGYLLSNATFAKRFFVFFGNCPDSGKSVWSGVIAEIVGDENVSEVPLHDLSSPFASAELTNARLNIDSDAEGKVLSGTGVLKKVTGGGGGKVRTNQKYGATGYMRPDIIKILLCTNTALTLRNRSEIPAIFRRILLVPFEHPVQREDQDPNLLQKLFAEKDYAIRIALGAYRNFLERGDFIFLPRADEILAQWISESDSVAAFLEESCIRDPQAILTRRAIYCAYSEFCRVFNFTPLPERTVLHEIESRWNLAECRPNIDGTRPRSIRGLDLRKN